MKQANPGDRRRVESSRFPEPARAALKPYARRVRWRHGLRQLCVCACIGIGAGLALLAVSFLVPIPGAVGLAAGLAGLVCLAGWAGAAVLLRRRPARLAAEIDGCGFQERVQTLLLLQNDTSAFAALQREDTLRALRAADPRARVPVRLPKRLLALIAAGLAAGCLLGFVPNPQWEAVQAQQALRRLLDEQAGMVEQVTERLAQSTGLDDARRAELNAQLQELARQLRGGQDYKEAVKQVSAIQQALGEAMQDELRRQLDAMQSAFEQVPGLQGMADSLQDAGNPAQATEVLRDAVAERIQQPGSPAARDMGEALRQAAEQQDGEAMAQALQTLADALEAGDLAAAEQALQDLQAAMEAAGEDVQALEEQLQMVRSRLGQAAAENGEGGQGSGGQQSGSQSQGDGQGQNGQGQAASSGQSQDGSGGQGQGGGTGSGQGQNGQGGGAGAGSGELADSEKVYDYNRLNGPGQQMGLPADRQDGDPGQQAEVDTGMGNLDGYVPYRQVVGGYAQDAVRAARRDQLPPAVQDWIEAYFAALQEG